MKISEVLLEYNLQNLVQLFHEKYNKTKEKDPSNKHESLEQFIKSIEDPLRKQNKFQFIDPYMKWIVQKYVNGKLNRYEDVMSKVVPGLLKYDSLKRKNKLKPEHKDINAIRDIKQLLDVLDQYKEEETLSGKEKEKEIENKFYETGEAILLHDSPEFKVVVPKSEKASCYFGRNTRWCTAATQGNNYFKDYAKKGDLYIVIIKKENKRFQFHFESEQFMDELDEPIDFEDFYFKYRKIYDFFDKIARSHGTLYFNKFENITPKRFVDFIGSSNDDVKVNFVRFVLKNYPEILDNELVFDKILKNSNKYFDIVYEQKNFDDKTLEHIFKNNLNALTYAVRSKNEKLRNHPLLRGDDIYLYFINEKNEISKIIMSKNIRKRLSKNFLQKIDDETKVVEIIIKYLFELSFSHASEKDDIIKQEKNFILSILKFINSKDEKVLNKILENSEENFMLFLKSINELNDNEIKNELEKFFQKFEHIKI